MGKRDEVFAQVRNDIARHGVNITWVEAGDGEPCFAYTVGLAGRDHPELIVFGLNPDDSQWVLNNLAFRVRDGVQRFETAQLITGLAKNDIPIQLLAVVDSSTHLTMSNAMYRRPGKAPVTAMQVVSPDFDSRWPWDEHNTVAHTPLLGPVPPQDGLSTVALAPHQP